MKGETQKTTKLKDIMKGKAHNVVITSLQDPRETDDEAILFDAQQTIVVEIEDIEENDESHLEEIAISTKTTAATSVPWKVDTKALTGLRGLVAMHIALGHLMSFSSLGLDLLGGVSMSFFYLLSGFIMSLAYGKSSSASSTVQIDKWKFWKNRFSRLYPMYIFTTLTTLPFLYLYMPFHPTVLNIVLTVLGLNMWLLPFLPNGINLPLNGVTWTIQTMCFFYLVFPALYPRLQRISDTSRRLAGIRIMYWVQLVLFIIPYLIYVPIFEMFGFTVSYWVSRAWPVSRLPVFIMGCLAAIERNQDHDNENEENCWSKRIRPVSLTVFGCCCKTPLSTPSIEENNSEGAGHTANDPSSGSSNKTSALLWDRHKISRNSALIYGILLCILVPCNYLLPTMVPVVALARPIGEAMTPLLFLRLLISLTETSSERRREEENSNEQAQRENSTTPTASISKKTYQSFIERICTTKVAQFLGDISMGFYLIHVQVVFYLSWALNGFARMSTVMPSEVQECTGETHWEDCATMGLQLELNPDCQLSEGEECSVYTGELYQFLGQLYSQMNPPAWTIPISLALAVLFGYFLTRFVEQPAQRFLRRILAPKPSSPSSSS